MESWIVPAADRKPTSKLWSSPDPKGRIKPLEGIVYHYTAGPFAPSLDTLLKGAGGSAHFLVSRTGRIVQLAPLESRTWHAGGTAEVPSRFLDRGNVNGRTIGIEQENWGFLSDHLDGRGFVSWTGKQVPASEMAIDTQNVAWQTYTEAQIAAVITLTERLLAMFPTLREARRLVGHEEVDPGRKHDPGPMFPWARIHALVGG